ncbi:C-terminal binding AN-like [Olea europaea subsp. europaea]|uniref:C-terminal binding AN-like n=1 Tax=Olea europaea subsp. europaea TaxID=158383 RepID=A0A8S0S6W6_OLEEU|nr:C-terminal binding AN-like [Olea europaea subsp. europaea]
MHSKYDEGHIVANKENNLMSSACLMLLISLGFFLQHTDVDMDAYETDGKVECNYYSKDMYHGEDGQLTWFNAGVRVGVGIGLGMCLGGGIGVGLLMHS